MFVEIVDSYSDHPDPVWINVALVEAVIVCKTNKSKIKVMLHCGKEYRADREYLQSIIGNKHFGNNTNI